MHLLVRFYRKDVQIIGSKAPGNYLDQFWSNKVLVLLCEGPESPNSMISGFLNPGEPLFMDLHRENTSKIYKLIMETFKKTCL